MSKLEEMMDAAGARADGVNGFVKELLLALEARIEAVEPAPQPQSEPAPVDANAAPQV